MRHPARHVNAAEERLTTASPPRIAEVEAPSESQHDVDSLIGAPRSAFKGPCASGYC
jgi:hypothetical protein